MIDNNIIIIYRILKISKKLQIKSFKSAKSYSVFLDEFRAKQREYMEKTYFTYEYNPNTTIEKNRIEEEDIMTPWRNGINSIEFENVEREEIL